MANQVVVTNSGNVQVSIEPQPNVQVQISRAAIGNVSISNVANANYANFAGTVVNASQPNITSLGTITGLTSTGNIVAPFFIGNVVGNISGNIVVPGSNTAVLYNNQGNAGASDAFKFDQVSNTVTILGNLVGGNISGNGAGISNIAGANVSGYVANATHSNVADVANSVSGSNVSGQVSYAAVANSVSVGNVVGIGNISTINLNGSGSNVLLGNGAWGALPSTANANYANFAGTAFSVAGANVSGTVANANYAAYAGNVVNGSQPNITSVGNLSALTVTGNISAGNISGGNLVSANYLSGDGYLISNLSVGAGSSIVNGNSNVTVTANSNVNTSVNGVANVYVVTSTGANLTGNLQVTGNVSGIDSLTFDTANAGNGIVAQMSWDDGQGTVDLVLKGGNVTAKLAEQEYARVYNAEANSLSKGEVVYVSGAQGNLIKVNRAQANAEATSVGTLGVVAESISAGGEGFIQTTGAMYKLNTNTLTAGNVLYLSPSTPGAYTQTKPVAPDQLVTIGYVERVSATVGSIYIKIDNGYELDELHNVLITSPSAGQALVYNGSNLWVNGNPNIANIAYSVSGSNVVGDVSGANHANIADVANSVSGANVSGEVANANYATYAGTSAVANSVAVANVVGIGNIATVNLDGSSSNVLYGNGVFAPESSNGNANYANFAGTLINGSSNISILPNAQILFNTAGNANTMIFNNGQLALAPQSNVINGLVVNSYGNSAVNDVHRIASFRYRGNITTPTSVQPNDNLMRLLTAGSNGTALQTNSTASIRATVDSSYVANGANIPVGWVIQVNDTNGGVNNQQKTHNFYSNGNVNFANSVFANNDFYTSYGNITANLGVFYGNGSGLTNLTGSNVTGAVPYASVANSVAGANVSGEVAYAAVANSVAGANVSGEVSYAAVANSVAVANVVGIGNIATINLDGSSSNVLYGNGVFSNIPSQSIISNGTSNVTIPASNGNVQVNVNGNAFLDFANSGGVMMNAYPLSTMNNYLRVNSVARGGNAAGATRLASYKSRGTVASPLSVQPNDTMMDFITFGHNGTAVQTNSAGFITARVDSSYTANSANIPIGWQIVTCTTNNQLITNQFYANGAVALPGGNVLLTNALGGSTKLIMYGDKTTNSAVDVSDAQFSFTMNNVDTTTGFSPFRFQQYAPNSNRFGSLYAFRSRGTDYFNQAPVVAADKVFSLNFLVNSNNVTTSIGQFESTVNYNDNNGNVGTTIDLNATGSGTVGYDNSVINLLANNTNANNINAGNIVVLNSGNVSNLQLNKFQETVYSIGTTSGTITPDFNNGSIQSMTLNGAVTINSLANSIAGRSMTLIITQDGTGGRTLTSTMKFAGGSKTLSTAAGAIDIISVFYDGSTYYAALTTGYA